MSWRTNAVYRQFSPQVEVYSIDEAFIDMNGIRSLWRKSFRQLADEMRSRIYSDIGITVSVGISTTRILAKVASEKNKPNGSTVVPGRAIRRFLADIPLGDVPGIGRKSAERILFEMKERLERLPAPAQKEFRQVQTF